MQWKARCSVSHPVTTSSAGATAEREDAGALQTAAGKGPTPERSERTPPRGTLRRLLPPVAACLVVIVGALIPLYFNSRFYYYADTQDGAFGIWFELGEKLRNGEWPIFSTQAWMAGNYAAEGQWGLWNPLILGIGLLASYSSNVLVFSTLVKLFFMVVAAAGIYPLARSYGAKVGPAFVVAAAAPLAGFTLFMDAPSWVTNLMVWSLLPAAWCGLRSMVYRSGSPILALVAGYLLITIGYVHGTLMLVFLFLGLLLEALLLGKGRQVWKLLATGAALGLIAVTVYLPGVLSAGVTARADSLANDGFMVADLTGLASAGVATSLPQLIGWWGTYAKEPLLYIAWFLPLYAWVRWSSFRQHAQALSGLLFMLVLSVAFVVGPGQMGPLRYPARIMPFVALTVLVLLAVLLSRMPAPAFTRMRLGAALVLVLAGTFLAFGQDPLHWRRHVIAAALSGVGVYLSWLFLRRSATRAQAGGQTRTSGGRSPWLRPSAVIAVVTLATVGVQAHYFARDLQSDPNAPVTVAEYQSQLPQAEGDTFVVGTGSQLGSSMFSDTLLANTWYLNRAKVQNLYTPLQYKTYSEDLCMTHRGETCPAAFDKLFSVDAKTGLLLVDLLSIDSVQVLRTPTQTEADLLKLQVPAGWERVSADEDSILLRRMELTSDAGGVEWATPGLAVTDEANSPQKLSFRVGAVPSGGGQVVLSRLAWPGYTVSAGTLADPDRDYLVTVNVPADAAGTVIELDFQPPGWSVAVGAFVLGMVLMVLLSVLHLIQRVRNRRRPATVAPGAVTPGAVAPGTVTPGTVTPGTASEGALER
ncbi:MAG: hypothetical protein JWO93_745 [Micrococcaceae bacterium]|nr:hypothetical protein [Micrococcaceae bacterium]